MFEKVRNFYENYDEEGRLFKTNRHLMEYQTTIRYFDRLFQPNSKILDACAGAGRYSFYLADKGHKVTACDLVKHNVEIIRANPNVGMLSDISVCNVLDLSQFEENSFDVVLCMGAVYHLGSDDLRVKAISECARVCKSGGIIAITYVAGSLEERFQDIFFCTDPHEIEELTIKADLRESTTSAPEV